jgi:hypothetical protein
MNHAKNSKGGVMRILTGLLFLVATSVASAQVVFAPSFSYVSEKGDLNGAQFEDNMTFLDFRLGYLHSSGLFLGGMYSMTNLSDVNDSNKGYAAGPTLGFSHYSGFYALFTYFLVAEQDASPTQTFTDGMGPQLDVGWAFPLTAMFHLGPQISYRSITFDKEDNAGVSTSVENKLTYFMPAIVLWFNF